MDSWLISKLKFAVETMPYNPVGNRRQTWVTETTSLLEVLFLAAMDFAEKTYIPADSSQEIGRMELGIHRVGIADCTVSWDTQQDANAEKLRE